MKSLQTKESLLKQTIAIEKEDREREAKELEEEKIEVEKEMRNKAEIDEKIKSELELAQEEANRKKLLNDVISDAAQGKIPNSLAKIFAENTSKYLYI